MANPPGSLTLEQELQAIKRRLDELSQRKIVLPACRVRLDVNPTLPANTDTFAQGGWHATEDPYGMFTAGNPSVITIQHAGFYHVHFHCATTGPTVVAGQNPPCAAAKVTLNGQSITDNTIATDADVYKAAGSDGAVMNAVRDRIPLTVGDRLYWAVWTSATATLRAELFTVPTEISVRFLGSR